MRAFARRSAPIWQCAGGSLRGWETDRRVWAGEVFVEFAGWPFMYNPLPHPGPTSDRRFSSLCRPRRWPIAFGLAGYNRSSTAVEQSSYVRHQPNAFIPAYRNRAGCNQTGFSISVDMRFSPRSECDGFGLETNDVNLWIANLDAIQGTQELHRTLSPDEVARAARFAFDRLRSDFRTSRGCLRRILAGYAGVSPESLVFSYSANGKPSLRDFPHLNFNISHSGRLMVCGVTAQSDIGVDVEQIRCLTERSDIARRFFSRTEATRLQEFPETERDDAFFRCWTRKEAFVKATGDGLSRDLSSFSVSLEHADETSVVFHSMEDGGLDARQQEGWSVYSFVPAPGYIGSTVIRTPVNGLKIRVLRE